jgi:hypothetical protein
VLPVTEVPQWVLETLIVPVVKLPPELIVTVVPDALVRVSEVPELLRLIRIPLTS